MQVALIIYESPRDFDARGGDMTGPYIAAWRTYHREMVNAGVYVGGEPLQPAATASTVRVKNGERSVHDGPYVETKEVLGGFILLEVPSLDAALGWAARCPVAKTGAVEVRPIAPAVKESIVRE